MSHCLFWVYGVSRGGGVWDERQYKFQWAEETSKGHLTTFETRGDGGC